MSSNESIPDEVYVLAELIVDSLVERIKSGELTTKCHNCGELVELVAANTEE